MKFRKKFWVGIVASFLTAATMVMGTQAADMRTVAVISIADALSTVKSLKSLTTQAGFPDAMTQLEGSMQMLQGVDWSKPIGIVILADDSTFAGYAFLPVADMTQLPMVGQMIEEQAEKESDGSYMIPLPNGMPVYAKQAGKWAYVSVAAELPKSLPADPTKLLEGFEQKYVLGAKINVANLPKDICEGYLALFRNMAESQAADEAAAENIGTSFEQVERMLNEVKVAQFGIAISPKNDITIESAVEAISGTVLAADLQAMVDMKTNVGGFFQPENNLLAAIGASNIDAINKKQFENQLKSLFEGAREGIQEGDLNPSEIETAKFALDNLETTLINTVKAGKIDAAATLQADGTILVGVGIADGNKTHEALVKASDSLPEEYKSMIKVDDSNYAGFNVTSIVVPLSQLPEKDKLPEALKNKTLTAKIGIKNEAVVVATGITDAVESDLKKAIDASKSPMALPTTSFVFRPYYLAGYMKTLAKADDANAAEAVSAFEGISKDAKIAGSSVYSGNAQSSKIVIDNELLPVIGTLLQLAQKARQSAITNDDENDFGM